MYKRIIQPPLHKSFFLFGPRGTGKTTWLKTNFPKAIYLDLLEAGLFNDLLARPERLENFIAPDFKDWVILDEVQRIPALLNEIHRLIESRKIKFILTGSSARKLKKQEMNLLAGRALTYHLYPLTIAELGNDFDLQKSLKYGNLPAVSSELDPKKYLESYVMTYLEQEIQQEGLTRNLGAFTRFLETASFSQGSLLNISEIARECAVHRKAVENYFSILDDLMIAYPLPVFSKKAKRRLMRHVKFYFFDTGVYRTLRPKGPLDAVEEAEGIALETLLFQEMKALNDYFDLGYQLFYWRTANGLEVDFVLYGAKGIKAIEIKRTSHVTSGQLRGLKAFLKDYPDAKAFMLYGGSQKIWENGVQIIPVVGFLKNMVAYLK
ncbi:ATP-binding protein [Candidatus Peregrinibacteria bacterium]|nr:ATP-binding protein [Candidatus Peregrinibacteria bacterium]